MKRRNFIKAAGGLTAGAVMAATAGANTDKKSGKPNLLVIMTDEHNFRTLGCYRKTLSKEQAYMWGEGNVVETPNIDSIANEGALCTNFYSTSPVCSPARGSFMSGMYPQNTPVLNNDIPMKDELTTFATILQKEGYSTGYSGKWHLDGSGKPQWGPKRQFGFADNRFMFNRGHWKVLEDTPDGPRVKVQKNGKPSYDITGADGKSFTTDWLTTKTVNFIEENKDKPFCYMVSYPDPHGPDKVRSPYDKMYTGMKFTKPRTSGKSAKGVPDWASPKKGGADQAQYYGMIKCIDDNIKRILSTLRKHGILDNTVVVFTSDHGDMRGEHDRQNKGTPLEASAKVPFMVRFPEKIKASSLIHDALGCVDFLPTILGIMGVSNPQKVDGRDASILFSGTASSNWQDISFLRGTGTANWIAAVDKRYKLILSQADEPWLIDKKKDPDELTNFCFKPECREIVRKLAGQLQSYGEHFSDASLKGKRPAYDLAWAVGNSDVYNSQNAPSAPLTGKGKKNKKEKI